MLYVLVLVREILRDSEIGVMFKGRDFTLSRNLGLSPRSYILVHVKFTVNFKTSLTVPLPIHSMY